MSTSILAAGFASSALLAQATTADSAPPMDWLGFFLRLLHIFSAMILVGGAFYQRLVLIPSAEAVGNGNLEGLREAIRPAWSKWVAVSAALLLVSGLYTMGINSIRYKLPMSYNILFLVKFLLALFIFFVASILAGRTALADKFRQQAKWWLSLNLTAALVVVAIAGIMRLTPRLDKPAKQPDVSVVFSAQQSRRAPASREAQLRLP